MTAKAMSAPVWKNSIPLARRPGESRLSSSWALQVAAVNFLFQRGGVSTSDMFSFES